MSRDVSGQPWKFDGINQGEGRANVDQLLRTGTFTTTNASDLINFTAHGYLTGDGPIQVEEGNSDLPSGLAESTDYFIIRLSADTFSVALTRVLAVAGTAVAIADDGTTPNYILQKPNNKSHFYIKTILIDAGATGGTFEVSTKSGGRSLTGVLSLAANTHEQIVVGEYVDGVFMTSMADGQILVYHGGQRRF